MFSFNFFLLSNIIDRLRNYESFLGVEFFQNAIIKVLNGTDKFSKVTANLVSQIQPQC
jgi:hypothetical protein